MNECKPLDSGMSVPPWRRSKSILSKWFLPVPPTPPTPAPASTPTPAPTPRGASHPGTSAGSPGQPLAGGEVLDSFEALTAGEAGVGPAVAAAEAAAAGAAAAAVKAAVAGVAAAAAGSTGSGAAGSGAGGAEAAEAAGAAEAGAADKQKRALECFCCWQKHRLRDCPFVDVAKTSAKHEIDAAKPLDNEPTSGTAGLRAARGAQLAHAPGRGLHSSTFQLNLRRF